MLFPIAVALASVLGGTALGLVPRERTLAVGRIRWLAAVASLAVVAGHLLPEAFHEIGWISAIAFAAGLLVPVTAERLGRAVATARQHASPADAAHDGAALASLELGYVGLLAHRFGDGLAMGAAWSTSGSTWGRIGVVVAISAHIVPVTTVMILALAAARGPRSAFHRGLVLAASTAGGVVAAEGAATHAHGVEPYVSAIVAGLLVHIVGHRGHVFPGHSHVAAGEK